MATKPGTLLTNVADFPKATADRLAQLWLTTAEELMSAANQVAGKISLATFLGVASDQVDVLIAAAQAVVPEGVSFNEEDIELPLGALSLEGVASAEDEPVSFAERPEKVDLHAQMPPVRNQGYRGTCVAHATSAVREYLLGEQSGTADLSEQFIYWACKERDHYSGEGTWIHVAMDVLQGLGVCSEGVWKYNQNPILGNVGQGPAPENAIDEAKAYRVANVTALNARWVDSLRDALVQGSPVAFSVEVFQSMQRPNAYRVGDVRLPLPMERNLGGHAMCMVGYVDDSDVPGGGYFIVRNSWGEAFGHDGEVAPGYCRLPYEYVRQHAMEAYVAHLA